VIKSTGRCVHSFSGTSFTIIFEIIEWYNFMQKTEDWGVGYSLATRNSGGWNYVMCHRLCDMWLDYLSWLQHPFVASQLLPLLAKICTYFLLCPLHETHPKTIKTGPKFTYCCPYFDASSHSHSHIRRLVWHRCESKTKRAYYIQALRSGGS